MYNDKDYTNNNNYYLGLYHSRYINLFSFIYLLCLFEHNVFYEKYCNLRTLNNHLENRK